MNIAQIKERVPLSDFLEKCGHLPVRSSGAERFYRSPYRRESTPSFTVNDGIGKWYDHGDARGGNIIDIATLIWNNPNIKEVVARINEMYSEKEISAMSQKKAEPERILARPAHEIVRIKPLGNNPAISEYLRYRGVFEAAWRTEAVKEVYYDYLSGNGAKKRYFGAGWQNESGGWEVRSKYGKTCIAARDILVLKGTSDTGNIFEGMMDYLSALAERTVSPEDTTVVLNGLGMWERGLAKLRELALPVTKVFLDNGTGGDRFTKAILEEMPEAVDMRHLYNGHGDYNEKLCADMGQKEVFPTGFPL